LADGIQYVFDQDQLFAITPEAVYGGPIAGGLSRDAVMKKLNAGDDPANVLGNAAATGRSRIARKHIRSLHWIEDAGFLVVKQSWLWDPIRFQFTDRNRGREAFQGVCQELAPGRPVTKGRIGMHDLPVDPKIAIGCLFAFLGLATVVCGAVDALPGNAKVKGGAVAEVLADFGRSLGPEAAFGVGGLGIVAAIALLAVWFTKRPAMESVRVR
jgi:hypothetical protein